MITIPHGRSVFALDAIVVAWTVAWIAVGIEVADTLYGLTELSGTFRSVGNAIGEVGRTLGGVNLPLVGAPLDRASEAVEGAGRDIVASGLAARSEIVRASILLGLAVALVPTLTLMLLYAPARVGRTRDRAALRGLVGEAGGDPGFEDFLAARAIEHLPYRRLQRLTERPWKAHAPATRRALAEEELRRLGVSRRALRAGSE
ncbi:MAG TPA: hypothetical protein VGV57_12040 [Thermoleophilaceae bacterium]|nr:hypothetical protein [Thermoleophilaceae bacterium]